jgi:segregation and condensation protein A
MGRDFFRAQAYIDRTVTLVPPQVDLVDLQLAWRDLLQRAKLTQHHTITRETLSVRDFMTRILRRLQNQKFVEFKELFEEAIAEGQGVPVLVVNFIALLELSRESLVEITQAEAYAPIYVRLSFTPQA